jgi:hypothetical protein
MSSLRKRIANRENGKLGGPVTPEGRAKSALNSIKHGLTANTLVLTNESRDMFNELLDAYTERFQPADEVELDLILEMVACRWRLRRIMSVETAMVDIEMDDEDEALAKDRGAVDEVCRIALAFTKLSEGRGLTLLSRTKPASAGNSTARSQTSATSRTSVSPSKCKRIRRTRTCPHRPFRKLTKRTHRRARSPRFSARSLRESPKSTQKLRTRGANSLTVLPASGRSRYNRFVE